MRLCYLIGYPVGHSMSAVIQNAAFKELELDYRYELRPVRPGELGGFIRTQLREKNVRGANITIPHKVGATAFLDELEALASAIGAVNTVVNEGGRLKGYNTDGRAAMRALGEEYGDLGGARAVIIGAGGAARAIGYHLSSTVEEIAIVNRTPARAERLAEDLSKNPECRASIRAAGLGGLPDALVRADILINATPLGMSPETRETPVDGGLLGPGLLVFDTVYNPMRTRLLREAEEAGSRTLSGVRMLVYQGSDSFRLWTGVEAPEGAMLRAVERALGGGGE